MDLGDERNIDNKLVTNATRSVPTGVYEDPFFAEPLSLSSWSVEVSREDGHRCILI